MPTAVLVLAFLLLAVKHSCQLLLSLSCYNHTRIELMRWVKHKNCVVSSMRWQVECQLNHGSVELTLSRSSQLFEGWFSFYIERVVSLMKTIVFNSIQVINYWFTSHRTLKPLYQQAQTSSPNIQGISDQNVTLWCVVSCMLHPSFSLTTVDVDEDIDHILKLFRSIHSDYFILDSLIEFSVVLQY